MLHPFHSTETAVIKETIVILSALDSRNVSVSTLLSEQTTPDLQSHAHRCCMQIEMYLYIGTWAHNHWYISIYLYIFVEDLTFDVQFEGMEWQELTTYLLNFAKENFAEVPGEWCAFHFIRCAGSLSHAPLKNVRATYDFVCIHPRHLHPHNLYPPPLLRRRLRKFSNHWNPAGNQFLLNNNKYAIYIYYL